jgi:hypothetical protein
LETDADPCNQTSSHFVLTKVSQVTKQSPVACIGPGQRWPGWLERARPDRERNQTAAYPPRCPMLVRPTRLGLLVSVKPCASHHRLVRDHAHWPSQCLRTLVGLRDATASGSAELVHILFVELNNTMKPNRPRHGLRSALP